MASAGAPNPNPMELEVTVISAKHLKNVNWRNGDLNPYATFWVDPDRRISTSPDSSGSTKPVWNETFTLPLSSSSSSSFDSLLLTLDIFHSNPSESPKPLVGTARVRLSDLLLDPPDSYRIHSLDLLRPSGRPQGKVRIKIGLRDSPPPPPPPPPPSHQPPPPMPGYSDYAFPPQSGYNYYSSAPPQPPPQQRDYRDYPPPPSYSAPPPPSSPAPPPPYGYSSYSDAYPAYYPGYYSRPPPPPQPHRAFSGYGVPSGPSAPVDSSSYEQRPGGGGGVVGSVTGSMGGLSLDERGRYEEEKRGERAEESVAGGGGGVVRDNFSDYRGKY